jgi:hypothetical protein
MLPQATTGQPEISRCWSYQIGDECLRLEVFLIQVDARRKLALWGHDESHHPPNSALAGRIQAEFAALSNRGKAGGIRSYLAVETLVVKFHRMCLGG